MVNAYATEYAVEGSVDAPDGTMFYMLDYDTDVNIDSAFVVGGQLRFKGNYSRPAYVRIENENGNIFSNCILDTLAILDFNTNFPSGGSALNKKLMEYHSNEQKFDDELALFYKELQSHGFEQPELGELYSHLYHKLLPNKLQLYYSTIATSPDGIGEAAVMSLNHLWGLSPDQWDTAYSQMPPYLKERRNVKELNDKYNNLRKSNRVDLS